MLAETLLVGPSGGEAWRSQALTDLKVLPDYQPLGLRSGDPRRPVGPDGQPIFYTVPKSFQAAAATGSVAVVPPTGGRDGPK